MKISLWAFGKSHDPMISKGVEEFTGRVQRYYPAEWKIFPPVKNAGSSDVLMKKEAEIITSHLKITDYLVALDERGKEFTSITFASELRKRADEGRSHLVFLIGGAFGIAPEISSRANLIWSLSRLTFPHQLVRIILAEQLYRACSINRNEKYHHE